MLIPLAAAYMALGASAATQNWTNATLGRKWTAVQLEDPSFAKEEMLARVHWRPPSDIAKRGEDVTSIEPATSSNPTPASSAATDAPPRLCIGTHNGTAALVPCHSPASALVFGTHDHIAVGQGCLTAPTAPTAPIDGSPVTIDDCDPYSEAQLWGWHSGEAWTFTHAGLCLDVTDGVYAVGTPLQLWTCEGKKHANQAFRWHKLLLLDYGNDPVDVDAITLSW